MPSPTKTKNFISPSELKAKLPCSVALQQQIASWRTVIKNIINHRDHRLLVIVGPCSIHDPEAAIIYAEKLANLADEVKDKLFIVMRSYFSKPRTRYGWKGWLNDPELNGSGKIAKGLITARQLLLKINALQLPCGMELLNPTSPQYLGDLLSWGAVGARTVESQIHRELISNTSLPVGFKNNTAGNIEVAINAITTSAQKHTFLAMNDSGILTQVQSSGNPHSHVILRGSHQKTNYDTDSFAKAIKLQQQQRLSSRIIIDCNHGNSPAGCNQQLDTLRYIQQYYQQQPIFGGVMLESHLQSGRQNIQGSLTFGQSITDPCLGWQETEKALLSLSNSHIIQ
jgi:3-deoxy-7-phosphoheptulonate synthase